MWLWKTGSNVLCILNRIFDPSALNWVPIALGNGCAFAGLFCYSTLKIISRKRSVEKVFRSEKLCAIYWRNISQSLLASYKAYRFCNSFQLRLPAWLTWLNTIVLQAKWNRPNSIYLVSQTIAIIQCNLRVRSICHRTTRNQNRWNSSGSKRMWSVSFS